MSILGYNTHGAQDDETDFGIVCVRVQAPANGDDPATAHVWLNVTNASVNQVGIYQDNGASSSDVTGATQLVVCTVTGDGAGEHEYTQSITIPALVSGTFYWVAVGVSLAGFISYDTGGATGNFVTADGATLQATMGAKGGDFNNQLSVWIDYTAAGSSASASISPSVSPSVSASPSASPSGAALLIIGRSVLDYE